MSTHSLCGSADSRLAHIVRPSLQAVPFTRSQNLNLELVNCYTELFVGWSVRSSEEAPEAFVTLRTQIILCPKYVKSFDPCRIRRVLVPQKSHLFCQCLKEPTTLQHILTPSDWVSCFNQSTAKDSRSVDYFLGKLISCLVYKMSEKPKTTSSNFF